MIVLNSRNKEFYDVLFNNNKLISHINDIEKNNSEELLTITTLIFTAALQNAAMELEQLEKILAACKLQKGSYKVEQQPAPWANYRGYEQIKTVLLFGISAKDLNISIKINENQPVKFDNRTFIQTASLADIMANQAIKNALWQNALKPCFIG